MSVALPSRRARAWRVALIDCMRGAARTVSGLGSSTGYFSPVDMAGFQAPVQCWPDFLLAASPRAHTRCFPPPAHGGQPALAPGPSAATEPAPSLRWSSSRSTRGHTLVRFGAEVCYGATVHFSCRLGNGVVLGASIYRAFRFFPGYSPLSKRVYTLKYGQANNRHIRTQNRVPLLIIHPSPCARGLIS